MKYPEITDPLFRDAVDAIDEGNVSALREILAIRPTLAIERLETPGRKGYFANPYLLWFVADNPIRIDKLPDNIVEIAGVIIDVLTTHSSEKRQHIIDYALGLVATGRIPQECRVQIPLMECLIKNGARVKGSVLGPIGQRNFEAAEYLLSKGAVYTLATAVGLNRIDDAKSMVKDAGRSELYLALLVASFFGKADTIESLLDAGADPNGASAVSDFEGFHAHATALHQAVYSGSLDSVKLLVQAGASLDAGDNAYNGTPLEWAVHMQTESGYTAAAKQQFKAIEDYLRGR